MNELKKFGEQGIQYNREKLETIPVDRKRVFKMKHSEDEDEEIDVIGDDVMKEIFRLRDEHYEKGTLQDFRIEPYKVDPAVEINTTVAEDEEILSICPPVREMQPQLLKYSKCWESFPLQIELHNHLPKCPKSTNKFSCLLCGSKFSMDFRCDYHEFHICLKMGNIHEKFNCGVCRVDFYVEQNFKIHQREVRGRHGMGEDVEHGVGRGMEADVGGGELGGNWEQERWEVIWEKEMLDVI